MKPLRLHIGALHRNRLPRLLSPTSSPPTFPTVFQTIEANRRHLLGAGAVAGVRLSPAVKIVEKVLASAGEAFKTTFTKNRVEFSQKLGRTWECLKKRHPGP